MATPVELNGLTPKERGNREEKEVAEEKEDGGGENERTGGGGGGKGGVPSSLASALDPSQFTLASEGLEVAPNLKKQKPGLNAFRNRGKADTSDPLADLDPIWSRKEQ